MKEQHITTHIGDEIQVVVFFDYRPFEPQTRDDPGCDSEVTINSICIDGHKENDIEAILNEETIDAIRIECFELMEAGP